MVQESLKIKWISSAQRQLRLDSRNKKFKSEIWKVDATFKGILLNPVQTE